MPTISKVLSDGKITADIKQMLSRTLLNSPNREEISLVLGKKVGQVTMKKQTFRTPKSVERE
jgi:hypothetical protein